MTNLYLTKIAYLQDPAVYRDACAALPLFRRERVEQMRAEADRRRSVAAWMLLRHSLEAAGVAAVCPAYTAMGKPFLPEHPELQFNLSHSGDWVLCAVSDGEVGCDVEQIRPANHSVASRFFAPEEAAAIFAAPTEAERDTLFYQYWTLKESFLKALGTGLTVPLNRFSIDLTADPIQIRQQLVPEQPFYFHSFRPDDHHQCACCSQTPGFADPVVVEF